MQYTNMNIHKTNAYVSFYCLTLIQNMNMHIENNMQIRVDIYIKQMSRCDKCANISNTLFFLFLTKNFIWLYSVWFT